MNKEQIIKKVTNYIIGDSDKVGSGIALHLLITEITELVIKELTSPD